MRRLVLVFLISCSMAACESTSHPFRDNADTFSASCQQGCRHDSDVCMDQSSARQQDADSAVTLNNNFGSSGECRREFSACLDTCAHTLP
jgi:hypothetical protein